MLQLELKEKLMKHFSKPGKDNCQFFRLAHVNVRNKNEKLKTIDQIIGNSS